MDATQLFLSGAKNCEEFVEALDIVKKNSSGKIWLIGGFVYRTIASQLYGLKKFDADLDFIIENPVNDFDLPSGWKIDVNRFGNIKLVNGNKHIDYVPLNNIHSIIQRKIEPTIENFLVCVPLTIQSIVYDIDDNKIIGEIGMSAIQKRVIEVNDLSFAEYAAKNKNKSLREMIQEKADSLGFAPIFPS